MRFLIPARPALAACLLGAASAPFATPVEDFPDKFLQLGTGPQGGALRAVGEALCEAVNAERPRTHVRCGVVPTAGSVLNLHGVADGSLQLGLAQEDIVADELHQQRRRGADAVRVVAALPRSPLLLVARSDAGLRGPEDLAGKRVHLGPRGSGSQAAGALLLRALNLAPSQLAQASHGTPAEAERAFCEHRLDALVEVAALPSPFVERLLACGGELLPLAPATAHRLGELGRWLAPLELPASSVAGQARPLATVGVRTLLVAGSAVGDEAVYRLAKVLLQQPAAVPALAGLEVPATAAAPVHAGAARAARPASWFGLRAGPAGAPVEVRP